MELDFQSVPIIEMQKVAKFALGIHVHLLGERTAHCIHQRETDCCVDEMKEKYIHVERQLLSQK